MIQYTVDNSIRTLLLVPSDCDRNSNVNSLVAGQNRSAGTVQFTVNIDILDTHKVSCCSTGNLFHCL